MSRKVKSTYVSPSNPSSLSVMVTVWLNTASWKIIPCREEGKKSKERRKSKDAGYPSVITGELVVFDKLNTSGWFKNN